MATPSRTELVLELDSIVHNKLLDLLKIGAVANALPLSFVVAIASRETNCVNMLGDFGHGVGIIQVDVQHGIARKARDDGSWKTPEGTQALINFGCQLLATNIKAVRNYFDDVSEAEVFEVAAAGYNCGVSRAIKSMQNDGDPSLHTTGKDYGADVVKRMAVFAALLTN